MQSAKRDQQIELKRMHIAKWRESGLKMSQYCKEAEIPTSTFSVWVKQASKTKTNLSPDFKRVVMQPTVIMPSVEPTTIEYIIDNKIKIKLHSIPSSDVIIAITKALMSCN